jgi:hypothetical protein
LISAKGLAIAGYGIGLAEFGNKPQGQKNEPREGIMSLMSCGWWWLGLGALCGWLLSWWVTCRRRRSQPVIERQVERVVEKRVEKQIDNPAHLTRIRSLEGEVAAIPGLRSQLKSLQAAPPVILEKLIEIPVDNPEHVRRIAALEGELRTLQNQLNAGMSRE